MKQQIAAEAPPCKIWLHKLQILFDINIWLGIWIGSSWLNFHELNDLPNHDESRVWKSIRTLDIQKMPINQFSSCTAGSNPPHEKKCLKLGIQGMSQDVSTWNLRVTPFTKYHQFGVKNSPSWWNSSYKNSSRSLTDNSRVESITSDLGLLKYWED